MTFLELVQELRRETSAAGSGITSVDNQTGEFRRLVDWIKKSYEFLQAEYVDWKFLRVRSHQISTTIGIREITPPDDLNVYDVKRFYDANLNKIDESDVIEYADLDYMLDPTEMGEPSMFVIADDNKLLTDVIPDAVYSYYYDYFKVPYQLTANADTPAFPVHFHRILVAMGKIAYGNYESAEEIKTSGIEEYNFLMPKLMANQLPSKSQYYGRSDPVDLVIRAVDA